MLNKLNRWLQDSIFKPLEDKKMPVMEHLVEFQVRLTRAVIAMAVIFMGTFLYADGTHVRADDRLLDNSVWEPAFGRPRDLRYAAENNAANLLLHADAATIGNTTWMVHYGPENVEPWGSNFYRGEHIMDILARRGVHNAVGNPVIAHSTHSWANADMHMRQTLPIHGQHLRSR